MTHIGINIKKIREQNNKMQKEVAQHADMQASNYSKLESGQRDVSVEALDKIANFFGMTIDEILHFDGKPPKEVRIGDKTATEKIYLVEMLDEEDKQAVYRIIDGMLTKRKFRDFFEKNIL